MAMTLKRMISGFALAAALGACGTVPQGQKAQQDTAAADAVAAKYPLAEKIYKDIGAAGMMDDNRLQDILGAEHLAEKYLDGSAASKDTVLALYAVISGGAEFSAKGDPAHMDEYPQALMEGVLSAAGRNGSVNDNPLALKALLLQSVRAAEMAAELLLDTKAALAMTPAERQQIAMVMSRLQETAEKKSGAELRQAAPRLMDYYIKINKAIAELVDAYAKAQKKPAAPQKPLPPVFRA